MYAPGYRSFVPRITLCYNDLHRTGTLPERRCSRINQPKSRLENGLWSQSKKIDYLPLKPKTISLSCVLIYMHSFRVQPIY